MAVLSNTGLTNLGPATSVNGVVTALTPGVTMNTSASPYPDIPVNGSAANTTPFNFAVDSSVACGAALDFNLTATTSEGTFVRPFQLVTGQSWPTPIVILTDTVEAGQGMWTTTTNSAGAGFAVTTEKSHSPTHSWTESPGGSYPDGLDTALISPVYDFTAYDSVQMTFWHTYTTESGWDFGFVEYSTDGGATWTRIAAYSGTISAWTQATLNLSSLAHKNNARLRFHFTSDSNTVSNGWWIDDIQLTGQKRFCPYLVMLSPAQAAQTADPGQTVTYTLRLTNTGEFSDTYDLTSAGNVWNVQLPITQTMLNAGQGSDVPVYVAVPQAAAGDASDGVMITATSHSDSAKFASAQLTTSARAVYGLNLTPLSDTQSGDPGQTVTYTLHLTNTANTTDTFDLTAASNWSLGLSITQTTLTAGASATIAMQVMIPSNALSGEADTAVAIVTSQGDASKELSSTLTTTANAVYGVALHPMTDAKSDNPGAVVTYTLHLTNTANTTDTFDLTAVGSWDAHLSVTQTMLAAGASASFEVHVTIPAGAQAGDADDTVVTVTSQNDASVTALSTLTTTANAAYGLALHPLTAAQMQYVGKLVTYTLHVTNTSNTAATFNITVAGNDWDTVPSVTSLPLAAGASGHFDVVVSVPVTATHGLTDTAQITVESADDAAVMAEATLTTTAKQYQLYLPLITR